jgi:hypothetical protein
MPLPVNYPTTTVHGTLIGLDGRPVRGSIIFRARPEVLVSGQTVVYPISVTAHVRNSEFTVSIPVNDVNISPTGWTYEVEERLSGLNPRRFDTEVRYSPTTVEYRDIVTLKDTSGVAVMRGDDGLTGATGPTGVQGPSGPPGSGTEKLFIQSSAPTATGNPYIWIQTFDNGDFTMWLGDAT